MCDIEERPAFRRSLRRLSKEYQERVRKALTDLSRNPHLDKPLKGRYRGLWRLTVGKYRIVYDPMPCRVVLIVIGHRETVY